MGNETRFRSSFWEKKISPRQTTAFLPTTGFLVLAVCVLACTNNPDLVRPPTQMANPPQSPSGQHAIPDALRPVFQLRCAGCHGLDGRSGPGGNIYQAERRSPNTWERFLHNPQQIQPESRMPPVTGLTDIEYRLFAEWLGNLTRNNPRPLSSGRK